MPTIDTLKTKGPDPSDLNKVQQSDACNRSGASLKDNNGWAALLEASVLNGTDPAERLADGKQDERADRGRHQGRGAAVLQYPAIMCRW